MTNPFASVLSFIKKLIDLKDELDVEGTIYEIKNNKTMNGANAWMLMCSIVIASLGLDLNSPAVIIGGMLISPLMSPILGVGLGVGIADMETIKNSLAHFGVAIIIALLASTLYFAITPLGEFTEQIASRTSPNTLDVVIAFFGGIAGIVSSSRKDKTNAIPGVAIATALMPPLCVTGYGIANGNSEIMMNSFYLFFLNSFFVALSTYFMVRYLNFPVVKSLDRKSKIRAMTVVSIVSLLLIIPSSLILRKVFLFNQFQNNSKAFIENYFKDREFYIDSWQADQNPNRITLKVYGNEINFADTLNCKPALAEAGLKNTKIQILSTSEISPDKFNQLQSQVDGITKINERLEIIQQSKTEQDYKVDSLIHTINVLRSDTLLFSKIQVEVKTLFPDMDYFALGSAEVTDFSNQKKSERIAIVEWGNKTPERSIKIHQEKLRDYLRLRTGQNELDVIRKSK